MTSEREKMSAGELYDPLDPELTVGRRRARELCRALNATAGSSADDDDPQRRQVLIELLAVGGDSVRIEPPFYCDYGFNIALGENVYFNFNCVILDVCPVSIGAYTLFGPAVQIYTATHPLEARLRREREYGKAITIGSDVWIGGGAIICPGVSIGDAAVIGAGSVVTRDIPDFSFAAGNPCRVIRELGE